MDGNAMQVGHEPDLNELIPAFLAADEKRRQRALLILNGQEVAVVPTCQDGESQDRWLNQAELARHLGIHPTTVRRWRIPCHRLGRVPRYELGEVVRYLESVAFRRRIAELKRERAR